MHAAMSELEDLSEKSPEKPVQQKET